MKRWVKALLAIVLFLASGVAGYFANLPIRRAIYRHQSEQRPARILDHPAPFFGGPTSLGQPWNMAEHANKVVVIFIWATFDDDSIKLREYLPALYQTFGQRDDFELIGIPFDRDIEIVKAHLAIHPAEWPELLIPGGEWITVKKFPEYETLPEIWIIDKQGMVRDLSTYPADLVQTEKLINKYLNE